MLVGVPGRPVGPGSQQSAWPSPGPGGEGACEVLRGAETPGRASVDDEVGAGREEKISNSQQLSGPFGQGWSRVLARDVRDGRWRNYRARYGVEVQQRNIHQGVSGWSRGSVWDVGRDSGAKDGDGITITWC